MKPTIAFVLCAGLGTRLRPLTLATPKPLIPIWNKPLLAHTLDQLKTWGVTTVYLNTHWLPEALRDFIAQGYAGLELHELHEPTILGTGGSLRNLAPHLKGEPFWLVNGDILFQLNPEPIVEAFERSGRFAAAWLEPKRGPRTVEMDYAGRITCWASPTPKVEHTYTFTGVSLLSPEVLDFLPQEKPVCSVVEAFEAAMFAGKFVQGVTIPQTYWNDAGTPEALVQAHLDAQKQPELSAYTAKATALPAPECAKALKLLEWKPEETIILPLGARGSQRTFWRLINAKRAVIAIAYQTKGREENAKYALAAKALAKAKIPVPKVLVDQPNLLILEDLGNTTLDKMVEKIKEDYICACHDHEADEDHACSCGEAHEHSCECHDHAEGEAHAHHHHSPLIHQVAELLAAFHRADVGKLPLEPPFDQALYDWEVGLYEQFVGSLPEAAKAEVRHLQAMLLAEPQVLVHRDFQSSNLLLARNRPYVIDFQGMRRGAALYDVASFLYDPYVSWGNAVIDDFIHAYAEAAGRDEADLRVKLPYAGVQRLMQALGAYHRLASVGQKRFLDFIPVARERAVALAQAAGLPALAQALAAVK